MELIITLGELKWNDEKTINFLLNILDNEINTPSTLKRRSGKINNHYFLDTNDL